MQAVTIVACSDLHGVVPLFRVLDAAKNVGARIVVVAGDVQTAYYGMDPKYCFEHEIVEPTEDAKGDGIDVVLTPGNHDFYLRNCIMEGRKFPGNLHVLCDSEAELHGLRFYGTPWVPTINGAWCYEKDDKDLYEEFGLIPDGVDVLVSHTPPLGLDSDEYDVALREPYRRRRHLGSAALLHVVDAKRPKCVICGHIHSGDHRPTRVGETVVLNAALLDEGYAPAYDPALIKIEEGIVHHKKLKGHKWRKA